MCWRGGRGWALVDIRSWTRCSRWHFGTGNWYRRRTSLNCLCPLRTRNSGLQLWLRLRTRWKGERSRVPKEVSACAAQKHQGVALGQECWKILAIFSHRHQGQLHGKDVPGNSSEPRLNNSDCSWLDVGIAAAKATARRTPSENVVCIFREC
jgi:hypothetical protein